MVKSSSGRVVMVAHFEQCNFEGTLKQATFSSNSGLSYARALRVIGQSLETRQTKNFALATADTGFVLYDTDRKSRWTLGRGIRAVGALRFLHLSEIHYSADDLKRLEDSGKEKRHVPAQTPDFYVLSQVLRTVGGLIDRRGLRLLQLSRRGAKVTLQLEISEGDSLIEEHTVSSLHDTFVGMFFDRRKKSGASEVA
jgi:hypothetical protein